MTDMLKDEILSRICQPISFSGSQMTLDNFIGIWRPVQGVFVAGNIRGREVLL